MCMPSKIRFVELFVNAGYRKVNLELWSKKIDSRGYILVLCSACRVFIKKLAYEYSQLIAQVLTSSSTLKINDYSHVFNYFLKCDKL